MRVQELEIKGCYEIELINKIDKRGCFIKTYNYDIFKKNNLSTDFKEEYYSVSKKNVLRGLHFQKPHMQHDKLVHCIQGEVVDILLDLRKGSSTYGRTLLIKLNSSNVKNIYITAGIAHGFYVLSKEATMIYKTTSVYSAEHDSGIYWKSINNPFFNSIEPIVSERDNNLHDLNHFDSPFYLE